MDGDVERIARSPGAAARGDGERGGVKPPRILGAGGIGRRGGVHDPMLVRFPDGAGEARRGAPELDRAAGATWPDCAARLWGTRSRPRKATTPPHRKDPDVTIDKQQILDLLRQQGDDQKAQEADGQLPEQVDPQEHAGLLQQLGIDPQMLIQRFMGGGIPGL